MIKAKEQFEIKEVGTIHTKEEPKCINIDVYKRQGHR